MEQGKNLKNVSSVYIDTTPSYGENETRQGGMGVQLSGLKYIGKHNCHCFTTEDAPGKLFCWPVEDSTLPAEVGSIKYGSQNGGKRGANRTRKNRK